MYISQIRVKNNFYRVVNTQDLSAIKVRELIKARQGSGRTSFALEYSQVQREPRLRSWRRALIASSSSTARDWGRLHHITARPAALPTHMASTSHPGAIHPRLDAIDMILHSCSARRRCPGAVCQLCSFFCVCVIWSTCMDGWNLQFANLSGPGCSSVGGGAFTELGPFYPRGNGRGLRINDKSRNKGSSFFNTRKVHVRCHRHTNLNKIIIIPKIM
jgi:hypothetical protein